MKNLLFSRIFLRLFKQYILNYLDLSFIDPAVLVKEKCRAAETETLHKSVEITMCLNLLGETPARFMCQSLLSVVLPLSPDSACGRTLPPIFNTIAHFLSENIKVEHISFVVFLVGLKRVIMETNPTKNKQKVIILYDQQLFRYVKQRLNC